MQPTDFGKDSSGRLVKTAEGYWAFVPGGLPPKLHVSWELTATISRADRALSELAGVARNLPNPHLLIAPFVRREAVLSSRIEGTQASLSDVILFEAAEPTDIKGKSDVLEVVNYVRALDFGLQRLRDLPLSLRLIREIHARLMEGVRGEHMTPGEFRRSQNWIGTPGCLLADATFVPPPVMEMKQCLDDFERYLHEPSVLPPLVRMAILHYQFESIHPFLDGNGRIGRLLLTLLLCAEKVLPKPLLYLSAYFEKHRDDYYRLLLGVSREGNWLDWIEYFLRGVCEQSLDAIMRSDRLLDLWRDYRNRIQSVKASSRALELVDYIFSSPAVTTARASRHLGVTHLSAQKNIEKLVNHNILREATGRRRNRVYIAQGIVDILDSPTG
jgi:Fic family protein